MHKMDSYLLASWLNGKNIYTNCKSVTYISISGHTISHCGNSTWVITQLEAGTISIL